MSLFGANTTFKKAVARMRAEESSSGSEAPTSGSGSSGIGALLDKIAGPVTVSDDNDGATVSEVAREEKEFFGTAEYERLRAEEKNDEFEYGLHKARIEDDLRRR